MPRALSPDFASAASAARALIRRMGRLPVSGAAAARFLRVPIVDSWEPPGIMPVRSLLPKDGGVTVYSQERQRCYILVNSGPFPGPRLNWTIAHEVGHVVLGHVFQVDKPTPVWTAVRDAEAHAFAAELLMPLALLVQMDWTPKEIAWRCGVSLAAAQVRLYQLRMGWPVDERGMDLVRLWKRRPLRNLSPRRETVADGWLLPGAAPVSDAAARAYLAMIQEEEGLRRLAADDDAAE